MGQTWSGDLTSTCFPIDIIPTCKPGYHQVLVTDVCGGPIKNLMYVCQECETVDAQMQTSVIEPGSVTLPDGSTVTFDFRTCSRCPLGQFALMALESVESYPEAACFQCPGGFYDPPKVGGNGKKLPDGWNVDFTTATPSLKNAGSSKTVIDLFTDYSGSHSYLCSTCQPGTFFPLDYTWTTSGSNTGAYNEYDSDTGDGPVGKCGVGGARCPCMVCPMNSYTLDEIFGVDGCATPNCVRKWHVDYSVDSMPCITCLSGHIKKDNGFDVFHFENDNPNNNYIGNTRKQAYRNQGLLYMQSNMVKASIADVTAMCQALDLTDGQTTVYEIEITDKIICANVGTDWYGYGSGKTAFTDKYGLCTSAQTRTLYSNTPKFEFIRCGHDSPVATDKTVHGIPTVSRYNHVNQPQLNSDGICQVCAGVHSVISASDAQVCNDCACPDADNNCKYKNDQGVCAFIPAGKYRNVDIVEDCPIGQFSELGHYYSGNTGETYCIECLKGTYNNQLGRSECKNCDVFWEEPTACNSVETDDCHKFLFYQPATGETACEKCVPSEGRDLKMQACGTFTGDCAAESIPVPVDQRNTDGTCFYCRDDQAFNFDTGCGGCDGNSISVNNVCVDCAPGKFKIGDNKCQVCQGCPVGYYMQDMSAEGEDRDCRDITQCTKCPTEQCNPDEVLVDCFNVAGKFDESGTCVSRELTQPTAVCPRLESLIHEDSEALGVANDDSKLSTFKSNFGLSGFTFEELFTKDPANVDFQCRRTCDGTSPFTYRSGTEGTGGSEEAKFSVEYGISDGGQCQGPFACNVMACTMLSGEDAFEASFRVPQACPVEDPVYDPDNPNPSEYHEAMQQSCATCDVCGTGEYSGTLDWGRGCAKECTRLVCADYEIFDWTRDKQPLSDACTSCEFLEDERLCTRADQEKIGFSTRNVSGLIPVIHFADCVPKDGGVRMRRFEPESRKSYPSYGTCLECDREQLSVDSCELREYFSGCFMSFQRLFRGEVVPRCKKCIGLEGAELRTQSIQAIPTDSLLLQCQIGLCNLGFSGIDDVGRVCFEICETVVCPDAYFATPCALPHRGRCFKRTPYHEDDRVLIGETPAHLNLLEKHYSFPPQLYARFENLLLDSAISDEQCVWNAQIKDNYMNPGGISTNFFDRDCREWSPDEADIEYPLLPLQNSVLVDGDTSGWRRFFTNTQAWAVAERTTDIGTTALKLDLRVKRNVSLGFRVPKDDIQLWDDFDSVHHFIMSLRVRATSPGVAIKIDKLPEFSDIFSTAETPSEPSSDGGTDERSSVQLCDVAAVTDKIHYTSRKCNFQFSYSHAQQTTGSYTFVGIAFDTYTHFKSLLTITNKNEVLRTLPQFSSLKVKYKAVDTLRLDIKMTKVLPVTSLQPSPDESCFVYLSSETTIYCVGDTTTRVFPQVRGEEITILRFFAPFKIEGNVNIYSFIVRADKGGKQRHMVYNHNTNTESKDFTLSFRVHALCQSQTSGNNRALLAVAEQGNVFMLIMFKFDDTLKPRVWVLDRDIKITEDAHHDVHWILASNANGVVLVVPTTDSTLHVWRWSSGFTDGSGGFMNRAVTILSTTQHPISAESTLETKFTAPPRVFFESTDLLFSLNEAQYLLNADNVLSQMPYDPRFTGKLYAVFFQSIVSITKFKKQSSETIHHQCHPGYQLEVERNYHFLFSIKSPSSSHCAQLCFEGRESGDFSCAAYLQLGKSECKIFDTESAGKSGVCKSDNKTRSVINTILSSDPKKSIDVVGQNENVNLYMNLQTPFVKITAAKTEAFTYIGSGYVKVDDVNDNHITISGSPFGESSHTTYTAADDAIHHLTSDNWYQPQWVPAKTVLQMPTLLGSESSQITYQSDYSFFLLILRMNCSIGLSFEINDGGSKRTEVRPACNGDQGFRTITLMVSQKNFIGGKRQRSKVDYGEKNQVIDFDCDSVKITLQSGTEILASKILETIYEMQDALNMDANGLLSLYADSMTRDIDTEWHVLAYNIAGTYLDMHEAITFNFEKETEDDMYVYVDDITIVPRLSHTSQYSVPIKCPEGSIPEFPLDPLSRCVKTPVGTFSRVNALQSEPCPRGTFSTLVGQSQCTECPAGKYLDDIGSSADDCKNCPSGKFSTAVGATGCSGCGVGQIYNDSNAQCVFCTAGKFSSVDETECRDCAPGFWSDEGVGSCVPCEIGTYSNETAATSIETCVECPIGTYGSNEGAVQCVDSPANTYQMKTGAVLADCRACSVPNAPATSTPGTKNVSQCVCGLGSYGTAGNCRQCPLHASSNDNAQTLNDCFCNAGFRQSRTRSPWTCVQCGEGSFSAANASSCSRCTGGKYSDVPGASECKFCPGGKSSVPGMAHCVTSLCSECPVGTYQPIIGAKNEAACLACEEGKFSYGLAGNCSACDDETCSNYENFIKCYPNSQLPLGSTTCICNAGYTGPDDWKCAACEAGKYKDGLGSDACTACGAGSSSPVGSTASAACTCIQGLGLLDASSLCQPCLPGTGSTNGDNLCTECSAGTYSILHYTDLESEYSGHVCSQNNSECRNWALGTVWQDGYNDTMSCCHFETWNTGGDVNFCDIKITFEHANDKRLTGQQFFGIPARFGPMFNSDTPLRNVTVVVVQDADASDEGCTAPYSNAEELQGNVALIRRGTCSFEQKVLNAQNAGAIAVIVNNYESQGRYEMQQTDFSLDDPTIPSLMLISGILGNLLHSEIGKGELRLSFPSLVLTTLWKPPLTSCPLGQTLIGSAEYGYCQDCDRGKYKNDTTMDACKDCGLTLPDSDEGSTSILNCSCGAGYEWRGEWDGSSFVTVTGGYGGKGTVSTEFTGGNDFGNMTEFKSCENKGFTSFTVSECAMVNDEGLTVYEKGQNTCPRGYENDGNWQGRPHGCTRETNTASDKGRTGEYNKCTGGEVPAGGSSGTLVKTVEVCGVRRTFSASYSYYHCICKPLTHLCVPTTRRRNLLQIESSSARKLLQVAESYSTLTRKLIVTVTLPTSADYGKLGLDAGRIEGSVSPLQGSNADNWERLHVRVLLGTHGQPLFNGCRYRVHVGRIDDENQLSIEGRHAELGCSVEIVDHFSDCYLEIPTAMANADNEVVVWAVTTSDTQQCEWPERFEVTLHPHTSVYQCPHEEFWSESLGKCVSCELEITEGLGLDAGCALGKYIKGCDVLAGSSPQCEDCPGPVGGWDETIYRWMPGEVCAYECTENYWRNGTECVACSNVLSCSNNPEFGPGFRRQACTDVQDEACVPCERPKHGVYSEFEEFVYGVEECRTDCIEGEFYRNMSTEPCIPCQTLTQLKNRLDATRLSDTFYRFFACTPQADSHAEECGTSVVNGSVVGDGMDFGLPCQISCDIGYHEANNSCSACPPTDASFAYIDGACTRKCNTDAGYHENGAGYCVNCTAVCGVGKYQRISTNPTCDCLDCARSTTGLHWQFVSPGNLINNAYSCTEECSAGYFADFDVCKPHSTPTCASNQFLVNGTSSLDTACFQCKNCNERRKLADCTATADTQCEDCDPPEPPVGVRYTLSTCAQLCLDGFVQRRSAEPDFVCDACVGFQCAPGTYTPSDRQNCTHCETCSPIPRHATFYGSSCQWACPFGWVRQRTADDDQCAPQVTDAQQNYEGFQDMRRSGGYGCPPLSCPYGTIPVPQLRSCSKCRPCNETAVDTPDPELHNTTWLWRTGLDCQFECKRGWFRLRQGTIVRCVDEATYEQQLSQFTATVSADATWNAGWSGERRASSKDDSTQFSLMLVLVFVFASTLLSITLLCT